jgi:hypothetical protein
MRKEAELAEREAEHVCQDVFMRERLDHACSEWGKLF